MDLTNIVEPCYQTVDEKKVSRADQIREYEKELKKIEKEVRPYYDIFQEMKSKGLYRLHNSDYCYIAEKYENDNSRYDRGKQVGWQIVCGGYRGREGDIACDEQGKIGNYFEGKIKPLAKRHNEIVWKLNDLGESVEKYSLFSDDSRHPRMKYGSGYYGETTSFDAFDTTEMSFNGYLKCKISSLMKLADKLGYVIVPREFMVDSVELPSKSLKMFRKSMKVCGQSEFFEYVMCPIHYIDLLKVVGADKMPALYFAPDLAIYETNLNMTLPLFRSLFMTTSVLSDDVEEIKKRLDKIEGANREKTKKEVVRLQDTLKKAAEFNMNSKGGNKCLVDSVLLFAIPQYDKDTEAPTMQDAENRKLEATIAFGIGTEFQDDFASLIGVKNNGITKKSKKIL